MNTAHPASLPPSVSGSGGIILSARAFTAAPSVLVKNSQGPFAAASGGSPAFRLHGKCSAMTLACPITGTLSRLAAPTRKLRRWMTIGFVDMHSSVMMNIIWPSSTKLRSDDVGTQLTVTVPIRRSTKNQIRCIQRGKGRLPAMFGWACRTSTVKRPKVAIGVVRAQQVEFTHRERS